MTWLLHWLWQGALVALVAATALRLLRRADATLRHVLLWIALGTLLGLPLAWPDVVAAAPSPAALADYEAAGGVVLPAAPGWMGSTLFGLWATWTVGALARLGLGWGRLRQLCRSAQPLPQPVFDASLESLPPLPALAHGRTVRILVSRDVRGACATGFGPPAILLSSRLVETLDPAALGRILHHEHAHLERGDHWGRLVQSIVDAAAGLHPAVAYLLRRLELEREVACDALVVARTQAAHDYARSLVAAASVEADRRRGRLPVLVPEAIRSASGLRVRLERLLHGAEAVPGVANRPVLATGVLMALGCLGAAGASAPAAVFVDRWLEGPRAAIAPVAAWWLPSGAGVEVQGPATGPATMAVPAPRRSAVGRGARGSATPAVAAAADTAGQPRAEAGQGVAVVLTSRPVVHDFHARPAVPDGPMVQVATMDASAWARAAAAGRAVGEGVGRAGEAVGGAAGRSSAAIGRGTQRAGAAVGGFFARAF